ncbi:GNAT family N-acetyltransferase [Sphingomicrobium marinum]|uniref:GNAT family N-acetyltransferase n=1 Tax=Sphingomicrobium marinum TaxID=1227950 RepID=UPI00223F203E|nr:GNAT family N-acetyltransferase [Sphingomicrobium marinum]
MDIDFTEEHGRGKWTTMPDSGDELAEMSFSRTNDQLIMIDHTYVPPPARGQGLGEALSKRAVEDARANGWKIIPVCPFFKAQAERHDWGDVVRS